MSSVPQLDASLGFLPTGRHRATEEDIYARYVADPEFAESATRSTAWDEYSLGRDLLRSKVRIHAVWMGGSFLTSKVDAKDVDALFIINARDYRRADKAAQQVVDSFNPRRGPDGKFVRGHGLTQLDSFVLFWDPFSPFDYGSDQNHLVYAAGRGYWDDFWARDRHNKPDGVPPHWRDALPQRGYLEVELDAWDR